MDNQHIHDGRATKNNLKATSKHKVTTPFKPWPGYNFPRTNATKQHDGHPTQGTPHTANSDQKSSHNMTKKTQILFDITKTQTSMSSPPMKPFLHDFKKITHQTVKTTHPRQTTFFTQKTQQKCTSAFPKHAMHFLQQGHMPNPRISNSQRGTQ